MDFDKLEYLNAGCGKVRYDNCINLDVAKNELVDADIIGSVTLIPFPAERFKGVICAHVMEHLPDYEHKTALREIWRVLKPNGILYIEVPNFETSVRFWLENKRGRRDYWYQCIYGRNAYDGDSHKSGFTEQSLTELLFDCGFTNLKWINVLEEEALLCVLSEKTMEVPEIRI